MTLADIESEVNVIVGKPVAWVVYVCWRVVCLLSGWIMQSLIVLGQRCPSRQHRSSTS